MAVCRFEVLQPTTLKEALEALSNHSGRALLVAGGTDVLRDIRMGVLQPERVVSLDRIPELSGIAEDEEGLTVGPLTTMAELAGDARIKQFFPALSDAAGWMGSPQVRNRATIGGNLCNARPCADSAPPSIVCDAILELTGSQGTRNVAAGDFMTGPGQTIRKPDEILTAIRFEKLPPHSGSAFFTGTNRKAVEITITSAAARITLESKNGKIAIARVCLGSVAPTPIRATKCEKALIHHPADETSLQNAAAQAVGDCKPIDDLRSSAAYRSWMVEVLVRRALNTALARSHRGAA